MEKIWADGAWDDYLYWQNHDKKVRDKINTLIKECERTPFSGLGKPEPLRHNKQGYWSRRITDADRFVYKVANEQLYIASCRTHYKNK